MIYYLDGVIKNYDWGKLGSKSLVNKFYFSNNKKTYNDLHYFAELWFGTHISGTSKVLNCDLSIKSLITKYANNKYKLLYNNDLPFILKLLSIEKPLSIQLHPNKKQAEYLHKINPLVYTDNNEKSEMAVSISNDFELLYGFDNNECIIEKFLCFPSIIKMLGGIPSFYNILDYDQELICKLIKCINYDLYNNTSVKTSFIDYSKFINLIKYLLNNYNNDRGVFISFFMKHLCLKKGEAIFLKATILHSYLKGDIVEIMTKSDNVLRCGLTSKLIDIDMIKSIIKNTSETPEYFIKPENHCDMYNFYKPPVKEFHLTNQNYFSDKINRNYSFILSEKYFPMILIVLEGNAVIKNKNKEIIIISKGDALFIVNKEMINKLEGKFEIMCASVNR